MCFFLTCGEQEFSRYLQGYENLTVRCHNCGNYSGHVLSRWNFFTLCFVPLIPLSAHRYNDVVCTICHFAEPLENRPDVTAMANSSGQQLLPQPQVHGGAGPPQGWGAPPQGPKVNQPMQYG